MAHLGLKVRGQYAVGAISGEGSFGIKIKPDINLILFVLLLDVECKIIKHKTLVITDYGLDGHDLCSVRGKIAAYLLYFFNH